MWPELNTVALFLLTMKPQSPHPCSKNNHHEAFHPKRLEILTDKSIFSKHLAQLTHDFLFKYLITVLSQVKLQTVSYISTL